MIEKLALVTGSGGFVGRHMMSELTNRGYRVVPCDIKTYGDAHRVFQNSTTKYDIVVHAAYYVGGRAAIDGVPNNLIKNIHLDAAMFEWAVRTKQKRVLYFSSSAIYPIHLQENVDRITLLSEQDVDLDYLEDPDGRYGYAKMTGEMMARAAQESGLPVTVVRPFSGYGYDQDDTYPFPAFIKRAAELPSGDPFVVWGPMSQLRDWIHISDVVHGALAVVESDTEDPVNICTGRGTSMENLVYMMLDAFNRSNISIEEDLDKPTGVLNRVGDPSEFHNYWTPRVSLEEGVREAVIKMKERMSE